MKKREIIERVTEDSSLKKETTGCIESHDRLITEEIEGQKRQ